LISAIANTITNWMQSALCTQVDPELFHPEKGMSSTKAKKICSACPVRTQCADHAINSPVLVHGVWGGLSEQERRDIRRTRGIRTVAPIEHGTIGGTKAHYRRGEQPCERCKEAERVYRRERYGE
jgi:WhiB family redox-sensing transcriptional regulator